MLISHEFPINSVVVPEKENEIIVHIHSTMNKARAKDYTMAMRGTGHRNEFAG